MGQYPSFSSTNPDFQVGGYSQYFGRDSEITGLQQTLRQTMEADGTYTPEAYEKRCQKLEKFVETKATAQQQAGSQIGFLTIKRANQWCEEAAHKPTPKSLWKGLWNEGEVCCLFADSNLGKSIYAVQIAAEIAKTRNVLYFDFEMSDKQFQIRYTDDNGVSYPFPHGFLRCEINPDHIDEEEFEVAIMRDIEEAAVSHNAKVVIIDNLTYLCTESERPEAAGVLMQQLMQLKRKLGLSILVLAHTPKRPAGTPLTQNDLAGSKRLFNFFDSCFAIGKSSQGEKLRYVKQIKCRATSFTMGADNIEVCEITKRDGFLFFEELFYDYEFSHLDKETSKTNAREVVTGQVMQLKERGLSIRDIASQLKVSKSKVGRIIQRVTGEKDPAEE